MARPKGTTTNLGVERFKERLEFLIDWFDPNPTLVARLKAGKKIFLNIFDVNSLFEAIDSERELPRESRFFQDGPPTRKTLSNYIRYNECSHEVIRYVSELYKVDPSTLRTPLYSEFLRLMGKDLSAMSRWKAANEHLAKNRGVLATIGKEYYSPVDELAATFPLVGRKEWILDPPRLLDAGDEHVPTLIDRRSVVIPQLEGLGFETWMLRNRLGIRSRMKRWGVPQYNGESYALLRADRVQDRLDFTFTIGKYYDYIDTCEAKALELADWHLQTSGALAVGKPERPFSKTSRRDIRFFQSYGILRHKLPHDDQSICPAQRRKGGRRLFYSSARWRPHRGA